MTIPTDEFILSKFEGLLTSFERDYVKYVKEEEVSQQVGSPLLELVHNIHNPDNVDWIKYDLLYRYSQKITKGVHNFHIDLVLFQQDWKRLKDGSNTGFIVNEERKIYAVLKNRYNTQDNTKRRSTLNRLENHVQGSPGATGYYVELIPENGKRHDLESSNIYVVDGQTFFDIVFEEKHSLKKIYKVLLKNEKAREHSELVGGLFKEAYGTELFHRRSGNV